VTEPANVIRQRWREPCIDASLEIKMTRPFTADDYYRVKNVVATIETLIRGVQS
jgi:hypothetical protein